jgi:predicted alpha/beta superfamily hydrolase/glyoxylase-like metal-dependent hydrolase (beta-lactamase superfamily II)
MKYAERNSFSAAAFSLLLMLYWPVVGPGVQADDELPLRTQKLSDRVVFAWVGDHMQMIRVVALSTARGMVVIETSLIRSADLRIRRAIEIAFGRKDFKYLINTHFHHDHTAGNQVYADATIVGHKTVPEGMKGELTGEGLVKLVEKFKKMEVDWGEGFKNAAPDSEEYHFFREGLILLKTAIGELQEGFQPTFPSVTFDGSLILDMGDMTLELYAVGGTHTPSDIMIFVPEEGLVAIGDMWPEPMLPYLRKEAPWNLDAILENWGRIVESGREIRHVNMAHSDMSLSVETFKEQYRYLKTLWDGLREMHRQWATLGDAKKKYTIERDFPHFRDKRLEIRGTNIHENNIEAIWEKLEGDNGKEESPRRVEIRDTEMRFLKSKFVDQTYEIDISLPKDYKQETARYPVLYVLDAEYNFGCVAYIVRRLIRNGDIPKILVVGVAYNTTEDDFYLKRERDCTPPSEVHGSRSGGAENFIRFFEDELIPTIDRDYRTIPGDRTIVGHSIGGLFGTYALFTHPDLFAKYLIVSPSLWYSKDMIFQYEQEFAERNKTLNAAVFLCTGRDENPQMIRTTDEMIETLEERRYQGLRLAHLIPEGEHHRSVFPYAFTKGIRWLFGPPT